MTKQITLTQGKFALVDDEDFATVSKFKWTAVCNDGIWYAKIKLHKKTTYLHRFLMSPNSNQQVDHKNRDGLDCRRENMRICSQSQNNANRIPQSNNTSGNKGVSWDKHRQKWVAQLSKNHKRVFCKSFSNIDDAIQAYCSASKFYYGEFSRSTK